MVIKALSKIVQEIGKDLEKNPVAQEGTIGGWHTRSKLIEAQDYIKRAITILQELE